VRKVSIALHIIKEGLRNTENVQGWELSAPRELCYAKLARSIDEFVMDTIISRKEAGFGLPQIAASLGLEQETVQNMGSINVKGAYQGKNQKMLTPTERMERDDIIVELHKRGLRQVDVSRQMGLLPAVVGTVIDKYEDTLR
jgi:hypothetical protein